MINERMIELAGLEPQLKEINEGYKELFNSMINSFALHEIIIDKRGVPINYKYLDNGTEKRIFREKHS